LPQVAEKLEKTLLLIKPDAVGKNLIGEILKRTEEVGFRILDLKMAKLSTGQARRFYQVHEGKRFYEDLVNFVSSGKVIAVLLTRKDAVEKLRETVGATDPKKAKRGTIRRDLATDILMNAVHASDSPQSFEFESKFFF
jgi:nucleoside-diphosphate kinase